MSDFYGSDLSHVHAAGFQGLAEAAAREILRWSGSRRGARVLDIGCGAGALCHILAQHDYRVWGLDISEDMISLAKRRVPRAAFACGSLLDVPFPDADVVAAIGEVLNYAGAENCETPRCFLRKVYASLRPGGFLLMDLAAPGRGKHARSFSEGEDWAVGVVTDECGRRLFRRITVFRRCTADGWTRSEELHRLWLWPTDEVTEMLGAQEFEVNVSDRYDDTVLPDGLTAYFARKPVRE